MSESATRLPSGLPTGSGRLILDPPQDGPWNMAADEVLLENAAAGQATLRFYHWSRPTISLGYFQSLADRHQHPASLDCPLVRRASGGGALVHDTADYDLTYSIALPDVLRHRMLSEALYQAAHATFVATLDELGIPAYRYAGAGVAAGASEHHRTAEQPFLCFQRHSSGDVLVSEHKVLGSAQRRAANGLLQHGSVLLRRTALAPELPGLLDLTNNSTVATVVRDLWLAALRRSWAVAWNHEDWTESELERIQLKVRAKFGHSAWTARR